MKAEFSIKLDYPVSKEQAYWMLRELTHYAAKLNSRWKREQKKKAPKETSDG